MRKYQNMQHAVKVLAAINNVIPTAMLIKASQNDLFKKTMSENDEHYSSEWIRGQLYKEQNKKVFNKLLQIFPTDHDFKIEGVDDEFLVKGG